MRPKKLEFKGVPLDFNPSSAQSKFWAISKALGPPKVLVIPPGVLGPIQGLPLFFKSLEEIPEEFSGPAMMAVKEPAPVKVYHKSQKQDWGTPQGLFNLLEQEFSFTLDACADHLSHKCQDYLSLEMGLDALEVDWWGRVFLNPPYNETKQFLEKAVQEVDTGHCELAVVLIGARPDTQWWWYAVQYAAEVRFLKGRLKFEIYIEEDAITTGLTLSKIEKTADGNQIATYLTGPAPFPSAVLVFDKKRPKRKYLQWDWQKDQFGTYAYHKLSKKEIEAKVQDELKKKEQELATKMLTSALPNDPIMNTAMAHVLCSLSPDQFQEVITLYLQMQQAEHKQHVINMLQHPHANPPAAMVEEIGAAIAHDPEVLEAVLGEAKKEHQKLEALKSEADKILKYLSGKG